MEKMTRQEIIDYLSERNRFVRMDVLMIYADAALEYLAAQENIRANGSIVQHPRTGAPIENPFLKVRDRASSVMRRTKVRRVEDLWNELLGEGSEENV